MALNIVYRKRVQSLKREFDSLKKGKESLLNMLDEVEVAESVYNSNAIENSTLTLKETEKILFEMEVSRNVELREVFEAKNLARVMGYIKTKARTEEMSAELLLLLHRMLISNIDDAIAGRFRSAGEFVRVGKHIAPAPEQVTSLMEQALTEYADNNESFVTDAISRFHLELERIHPFCDGNGRIGRVLLNYQLFRRGFPAVIIRDKEKGIYYQSFREYDANRQVQRMEKIVAFALMESLHKRNTYLQGQEIVTLADYARKHHLVVNGLINSARKQTIPAFRERGHWKIGADYVATGAKQKK
ncbi:MAG: Fic family protein [Candidatus Moranbacteria bacterium]|nr:Fic family protein [Candidatus Moranbacteria bacterium]